MTVRFSRPALKDLDEIFEYVARDNPVAARHLLLQIKASAERIGRYPYMGRATDDEKGARVFPIPRTNYKVFYDVMGEDVLILRVMHGARDT